MAHSPTDAGGALTDAASAAIDASVEAPADGRCGLSPQLLVASSSYYQPPDAYVLQVDAALRGVSGGNLYYATYTIQNGPAELYLAGSLMSVPVGGGSPTEIDSGYLYSAVLVTDTALFVERENAYPNKHLPDVVSIPRDGGTPTTLYTFTDGALGEVPIGGLAWDGTFLYVSSTEAVRAIPVADPSNVIVVRQPGANGIQVSGGHLVMSIEDPTTDDGSLETVPIPFQGDTPLMLKPTFWDATQSLVQCGDFVCWVDDGANAILQLDASTGTVTPVGKLPATFGNAGGFAFDGTTYYVTSWAGSDTDNAHLGRFPATDFARGVTLGTIHGAPSVAVDDECLYWSDNDGIHSVAKNVAQIPTTVAP
jgi:hypothetical protein